MTGDRGPSRGPGPARERERWRRIQAIVGQAIACADPRARARLLDRACGEELDVRRDVQSLLDAHDRPGPVDRLVDRLAPTIAQARASALGWEGRTIGPYAVLECLGGGGMGIVYKARDTRLGRHVALKFLPPHLGMRADATRRFVQEARAAATLDHPNICTIHEIGETPDGQLFIAMPCYDGETLQARLARGPLPCGEAVWIARQMADGLQQAHDRGIVHCDVKPSNVMLLRDGGVKILDFGVAKVADGTLFDSEAVLGTLAYMSPEQACGRGVDPRADVWSVGVVLYEMLTARRPFRGASRHALTEAIRTHDPDPVGLWRADVPAVVDAIVRRALAKSPEARYATIAAMSADLAAAIDRRRRAKKITSIAGGAERRWAAVLVSVVSDYGALVERLAPAALDARLDEIHEAAADVVRRHGGLVNQAIADEIVAVFGVPLAHEDDDRRAVRAALALHARIRAMSAGLAGAPGGPVRVQSGIHVGRLVAQRMTEGGPQRYRLSGAPARIAARLAALAPIDAVLVSPDCQRLVAPFVETDACPPLTLQADAKPLVPYRVRGESGLQTRLEAAERDGLTPYAGRDAELAALADHFARASAGHGRVLAIVGEAGAGKSRLLHEFRARIARTQARILLGRCRAPGRTAPYGPFVEMLREALVSRPCDPRDDEAEAIAARVHALDGSLAPFVPLYLHLLSIETGAAHALPRHLQGEHLRAALLEALGALVAVLARRQATVILLEDWQWADDASRDALRRIAEIDRAHALIVIVTYRHEMADQPVVDDGADLTRLALAPLGLEASLAIVRALFRVDRISAELAARVYERTGGNPFFLEQVCHTLLEEEAVAVHHGEAVAIGGAGGLRLPDTVQAVIHARLDRLDPHARHVLRVASVIGREFGGRLLGAVLGSDADPGHALDWLVASGLIEQTAVLPEPSYRFRHVLTQEVAYDSLVERQRRALHETIGRSLARSHEAHGDDLSGLLAHHFAHAEAWPEAIRYGRRAAARAAGLSQFADALAMLVRVRGWLPHLPDADARTDGLVDLLLEQERLSETLGLRGRQQGIIEELVALLAPRGASARLAQTYLRKGDLATLLRRFDAAERALGTALRVSHELGDAALEGHTLRSIGFLRWHQGRHAEALRIAESALDIDREHHDDLAVVRDLSNISIIQRSMGDHARALASIEEALAMPVIGQAPAKHAYALHVLANVHRELGDVDRALACLQRANALAQAHLLPIPRSFHLTALAHIDLQQGRIEEALRTYREAIDLSQRARHADGLAHAQRALGEVLAGLGRDEEALPCLRAAARLFAQLEDRESEAVMTMGAARILERLAAPPDAEGAWSRVQALCRQLGDAPGELEALEGLARTARRRGTSSADAIPAFEAALALAVTLGDTRRELSLRNTLGILEWQRARYAEALGHYEAALRVARNRDDRVHEGLILNSLGVTLMRLGRDEEARTALETSVALTRAAGARRLEAHALAALGDLWRGRGRLDAARRRFAQSLALRGPLGDRDGEDAMRQRIAEVTAMAPVAGKDANTCHAI